MYSTQRLQISEKSGAKTVIICREFKELKANDSNEIQTEFFSLYRLHLKTCNKSEEALVMNLYTSWCSKEPAESKDNNHGAFPA